MSKTRIGVDESGKGDYFGPLVIAACCVGSVQEAVLEGVDDSKKLTDKKVLALEPEIKRVCQHAIISIGPDRYNQLHSKMGNLNKLLAWGHARAIENLLEQCEAELVISDQFADPAGLRRALFERGRAVTLESRVRAESDLAVAAASVLARAEFLKKLDSLGKSIGVPLPKGAGPQVDATARNILKSRGMDALRPIAKMHFKTTQKIQDKA